MRAAPLLLGLAACQPVAIGVELPRVSGARTALIGVAPGDGRAPYPELLAIDPTEASAAEALSRVELGTGEAPTRIDVLFYPAPPAELGFVRNQIRLTPNGLALPATRCVLSSTLTVELESVAWSARIALPREAQSFLGDQSRPVAAYAEGSSCD